MTLIEYRGLRFVVMDAPSETNVGHYAKELQRFGVTDVARACEPTYSADALSTFSMKLHELNFKDGDPPPPLVVEKWLQLVASKFVPSNPKESPPTDTAIAVHCVAGLGRAPVLVAIALIEAGMPPLEAVEFIRSKRRGALNMKQIHFLDSYKRRGKGKFAALPGSPSDGAGGGGVGKGGGEEKEKCIIM
ncbi:protein-tyrosine phosphatase-like protein [Catenaria anguillulae PL171]|uniref:protein-tyrosine-phosphatase n=1 Tax=Catenaria anguillulae PL171 TaxID=765915 RepID=A0A1Y2HUI6_9FUNG|nr:protein-tyrosine phosphatase-like protein [Catenaria anguillulae PL171]